MNLSWLRVSPLVRLSSGLVALLLLTMLLIDVFFQVLPDRLENARQLRRAQQEALVANVVAVLRTNNGEGLGRLLDTQRVRSKDVISLAVRRADGLVVAESGAHAANWTLLPGDLPNLTQTRIDLESAGKHWGALEIVFKAVLPTRWQDWTADPLLRNVVVLLLLFFATAYLFLKQSLAALNPGSAIPDRVRTAYDVLSEGVLIIDPEKRVMLANKAFRALHPAALHTTTGQPIEKMDWLLNGCGGALADPPWGQAMLEGETIDGVPLSIEQPDGAMAREVLVSCSPILDAGKKVRGCLIAFADMTELHHANGRLRTTIEQLKVSQAQIHAQNAELQHLATRDPLTNCLNRRAFFELLEVQCREAQQIGAPISCIMTDIDHFKQFNDRYGHAIGDQVLQAVARTLAAGSRPQDLLCRYGGEEFTLVLIGMDISTAASVAERLRHEIEVHAGLAVRSESGLRVTSSFGVSQLVGEQDHIGRMIERADRALYIAKRDGRNQVCIWGSERCAG